MLAPIDVKEKGTEISVLVQDRNGCMQSSQRFLHQLGWRHLRTVPKHSTKGRNCERWWNEAYRSESEQTTHRQTRLEAAELARRVAAKRWLQHRAGEEVFDARLPTRIAGREELQVVAQVSSTHDGALRASGTDGVMTRPFYTTEEEKTHFRSVPLPLWWRCAWRSP